MEAETTIRSDKELERINHFMKSAFVEVFWYYIDLISFGGTRITRGRSTSRLCIRI